MFLSGTVEPISRRSAYTKNGVFEAPGQLYLVERYSVGTLIPMEHPSKTKMAYSSR